jgi:N-formylglutamate deformylase
MSAPPLFHLRPGRSRLVVSIPHAGTYLPPDIAATLTPTGQAVTDTDWHVDKLYAFVEALDVTTIVATHSRTVVDLNRGPDGGRLYPGQTETTICPTETFAGEPLYANQSPGADEIARRIETYWRPYHAALAANLARIKAAHGNAILLDAHSIRAAVPRLFAGTLPDLNFGTNDGASCNSAIANQATDAAGHTFSRVLNGRFKGGYITRHYGQPHARIHAIQLEMAQHSYMDEERPEPYDAKMAARLIPVLRKVVEALLF